MKRILIISAFMLLSEGVLSQQFQKQFDIALPDSIQTSQTAWADLDNDGLLDILLLSKTLSGKSYFQFVKGDTVGAPVLHAKKNPIITASNFILADYNRDNKIDIVVSGIKNNGAVTVVYLNVGEFEFEEKIISMPSSSIMKFADLDNDARPEWIISGEENGLYYIKILKQETDFSWKVAHDTLLTHAISLEIVDANGDGNFDVFVSGEIKPDSLVSGFLINSGQLYFKPYLTSQRMGVTSSGDFNHDGFFDILMTGQDKNGTSHTDLYESSGENYIVKNYPIVLRSPHPFAADLNSDGIVDVNYLGKTISNDTLNIIQYGDQDYDTLVSKNLLRQCFGDAEHDGDLDLLQVIQENSIHLVIYENRPLKKNLGPGTPTGAVALSVFNRLFMYWEKPTDDHTPSQSLTYDVHLNGDPEYQVGDFDLLNEKRLVVSHGNNGTENFRLLKNVSNGNFGFSVQAVDNAFHSAPGPGGVCIGNGTACANVETETETLSVCTNEKVNLVSPPNSLWFSFSKGFLGIANEFNFQADKVDTIFYYSPTQPGCPGLKAWTIKINNDTLKAEISEKYACKDAEVLFTVEPGWTNVNWRSQLKGDLGSANTIQYKVSQPDSIFVTLSNASGCTIMRKTAIEISKPSLQVSEDNFKILKGTSVQLNVGGAQRYEWTPTTGLSHDDIANPIATPASSIQYMVTGYDSLGCTDKASVNIVVEGAGFIPNLFTPNDDGKNDQLRIYGMSTVKDFVFTIYNREGSLIFKTTDVSEAVQRGWDGTKNGTKQPPGVYFWKVRGEVSSGGRILLNGKDAGSIVLVR